MMRGTHYLRADGEIRSLGVDYGGKVTLEYRAGDYLVVKNKGSMVWDGIGLPFLYAPTEWCLVHARLPQEFKHSGPPWWDDEFPNWNGRPFEILEELESQHPGKKWKACRDQLIQKAKKLAK